MGFCDQKRLFPRSLAARSTLVYALLAAIWILSSDRVLDWAVQDPALHLRLSVLKGWFFVAVTALLLYTFLRTQADDRLALLEANRLARVVAWRWEAPTGRWQFERSLESVLGFTPEGLAPPGALERQFHPEDLFRFAGARLRARGGTLQAFDARMIRRSGEEVWTQWTLKACPGGMQGVLQDVSLLREVQTQLLRHQRRALADRLAGGVAHDLKNLLQAILGCAEVMAMKAEGKEEVRELAIISKAAHRADQILQRMLGLVRETTQIPSEAVDLNLLTEEAAALLRHALPKGVRLHLDAHGSPLRGRFDQSQVLQVLMNLGLNARDAVGAQGWIRIQTSQEATSAGDFHLVEVSDSGPGIPEEVLTRLFNPFFTTKPEGSGTGLGLPMAKAIAEAHGGSLRCLSGPGEGARFRLTLPSFSEAPALVGTGN